MLYCLCALDNDDVNSDETQVEDLNLTYVPDSGYTQTPQKLDMAQVLSGRQLQDITYQLLVLHQDKACQQY